jgi:hypothetical protein
VPTWDDAMTKRIDTLTEQGIDPYDNDDKVFGETVGFVYCHAHLRAHATGWCTVSNYDKTPLTTVNDGTWESEKIAADEARALGFWIYGDPRPCVHCQKQVKDVGSTHVDDEGNSRCYPDKKNSPAHTPFDRF